MIFSYYSTATRTIAFGCIKWTPYVAFTGSFLDIVFGQYFRQDMRKIMPPKMRNDSVISSSCSAILSMMSCPFRKKWESGVWNQGTFRILFWILLTSYIEIILEDTISRVFLTRYRYSFWKNILSISHKLADAEPEGILDSWFGTQNEQKNTHNTVIEV